MIQSKTKIQERNPNTMQGVLSYLKDKNFKTLLVGSKDNLDSGCLLKTKLEWPYIVNVILTEISHWK